MLVVLKNTSLPPIYKVFVLSVNELLPKTFTSCASRFISPSLRILNAVPASINVLTLLSVT